jgi:hypothetical protein
MRFLAGNTQFHIFLNRISSSSSSSSRSGECFITYSKCNCDKLNSQRNPTQQIEIHLLFAII